MGICERRSSWVFQLQNIHLDGQDIYMHVKIHLDDAPHGSLKNPHTKILVLKLRD
jgi:hypothetical protein